jgi:hypothetical protein
MKRAPVHLPKSVLSERARGRLPARDFVFPAERRYPINDLYHGRLALIYVMSPSNAADRDTVVKAVLSRYPELRSFWESRFSAKRRKTAARVQRGSVVRPARPARPATVPARRRERRIPNPSSEDNMPIYVVNPLAYDETPVVMVGKARHRIISSRTPGKPGRRSERLTLPSSETHALNPKTGAAFCGAGKNRKGVVITANIHPADKKLVTCYRCAKILMMNDVDRSVPGIERRLAITERTLKPGSAKKREKHLMVKGGEQGRIATSNRYSSSRKSYRDAHPRTPAQRQAMIDRRSAPMYRGEEDIKDFEKYVGWRGRPTQTIGQKRSAILAGRRAAEEAARTAEGRRRLAETGFEETVMMMGEYAPVGYEERAEFERRAEMARRGRAGAAAAATRRAAGVSAAAERAAGAVASRRAVGAADEYMDNPRRGRKSTRSQKAGLAKGQNLMQQAAAAYRAGKYDSMQEALRGVARGGRRRNPTLLEESMVSNPRRKKSKVKSSKPMPARIFKGKQVPPPPSDFFYAVNPRRKGSKAAKSAQGNAARAMSLFRSGEADSLSEAWAMVKRGA